MANNSFLNLTKDTVLLKVDSISCNLNLTFMTMGIILNFIIIFIFSKKKLRESRFNWYLLVVAIFELIFCLVLFSDNLFSKISKSRLYLHDLNKMSEILFDFVIHTIDSYILLLNVFLTLDRLYAIMEPMKIKEFFTNLHAKKVMFISVLILISFKISSKAFCELIGEGNTKNIYCLIVSPIIFNLLPLLIICVLNVLLVKELICYYKKNTRKSITTLARQSVTVMINSNEKLKSQDNSFSSYLNRSSKKKLKTKQKSHYLVILLVSIWSIITTIPYYLLNSNFSLYQIEYLKKNFDFNKLVIIQIIFAIIFNVNHSIINFLIYFCFYSDFKAVILNFNVFRKFNINI
jgi:hypothetical protein